MAAERNADNLQRLRMALVPLRCIPSTATRRDDVALDTLADLVRVLFSGGDRFDRCGTGEVHQAGHRVGRFGYDPEHQGIDHPVNVGLLPSTSATTPAFMK